MTTLAQKINLDNLVPMNLCADYFPLKISFAYAHDAPPNIFGKIYHDDAKLWLHEDLAKIVCLAAKICHEKSGHTMVLYDGLRTSDAQEKMAQSDIVKENPQWMVEPRLLSPPGAGAHPRGMAIDIGLMDKDGNLVEMGTVFDHLADEQGADKNPAHRAYKFLKPEHADNRNILTNAMMKAADSFGITLVPYSEEWWDFRFEKDFYEQFEPLSDEDLPQEMRMVDTEKIDDFEEKYEPRVQKIIRELDNL